MLTLHRPSISILTGCVAVTMATGVQAQSDVIGVQFRPYNGFEITCCGGDGFFGSPLTSSEEAGVVPQTNFNVITNQTSTGPFSLVDSEADPTTVTLSLNVSDGWETGSATGTPNQKLVSGKLGAGGGQTATFTLGGVGPGVFDLLVYTVNDGNGNRDANYSAGGTTYFIDQVRGSDLAAGFEFTQGLNTDPAGTRDAASYVRFSGLQADLDGNIIFTSTNPNAGDNTAVNGFQLVPVPEPTVVTALLGGMGLLLGLSRAGRRRS